MINERVLLQKRITKEGVSMRFLKAFLVLLLLPSLAWSGVNLKNGNFYISYTDIIVPGGGQDLEIARTYNSKSTDKGWFGFGWGSPFETYLSLGDDATVVVHENGSGATTRFTPKENVDPAAAAKKIIEAMRKKTTISTQVAESLVEKLKNDAELRQAYGRKFDVKAELAAGTKLFSNTRGIQELYVTKTGYMRKFNDGKEELFNSEGKLLKVKNKYGYEVDFVYEGTTLKSIKDSQAKQLFFDWYADGKVKHVWSAGDKKTFYKYKGDDLIESTDVGGNKFVYGYDTNHNLSSIGYADESKMLVKYTAKTQFVEEITSRNGEVTKYDYGSNPKNPEYHYWTIVKKKGVSGKEVANRYEYEIKSRPDGSDYTYRILTEINGLKTETFYTECCSLPSKIIRGDRVTTFDYHENGLLKNKASNNGEFVKLEYHPKFNKITKVNSNKGWTNFEYDKNGNLSKAVNDAGMSVLLLYDRQGRITKMLDNNKKTKEKRTLSFKYNALGKPVEIAMDSVGKINVSYDNYGEIKKVESKAGHKMALQVTQAFQSLLSIVKPAGVNLNM